jgi:hypothetical protein
VIGGAITNSVELVSMEYSAFQAVLELASAKAGTICPTTLGFGNAGSYSCFCTGRL